MRVLGFACLYAMASVAAVFGDTSRVVAAENRSTADFHVAVSGDDRNPGTASEPFASIARARDAVREKVKLGLTKSIVVEIHGGTYRIGETLEFHSADSGTREFSITYVATEGERVVLDGGRVIGGWKQGERGLWTTTLSDVKEGRWYPRQLFVNGQRAIRARTPNRGWVEGEPVEPIEHDATDQRLEIRINTTGGKGIFGHAREFEYQQSTIEGGIAAWGNVGDIELVSLRHNEGGRKALLAIDPAAQTVTLRPPHRWAPKVYGNDWFNGVPDGRCYLENAAEFLDSPGEWYLDRTTGILSYLPRAGEDPATSEFSAPVVQKTLLLVRGSKEKPVVNLHFRGLHVEDVDWPLPELGYSGLFCCNVSVFREGGNPGHRFIDAAVEMENARECSFRDGGVSRVGAMGLVLRDGTAAITVEGNQIEQTGAGGIGLGQCNVGFGYLLAAPPIEAGEHERFRVCNNHVQHCGLDYFGAVGIALFRLKDSTISHNLIHDTAYCGVVFPGDQDPKWKFSGGNRFERNHIYHDMRVTQDGAGFYTSFAHLGTVVGSNLIHDSSGNPMSGGFCLDGCSGVTFDDNVVYGNPVWSLVLFRPVDLAANRWTGNLVMPTRKLGVSANVPKTLFDGRSGWELRPGDQRFLPPQEFLAAMEEYVGLQPEYRERLQGVKGRRWERHALEGGTAWQLDLATEHRGVVYRIPARAGLAAEGGSQAEQAKDTAGGAGHAIRFRSLDPAATYRLTAHAGAIQMSPTDSSTGNFTSGPLFPMVREVGALVDQGIPASATGKQLMEDGIRIKDESSATWVVYERMP